MRVHAANDGGDAKPGDVRDDVEHFDINGARSSFAERDAARMRSDSHEFVPSRARRRATKPTAAKLRQERSAKRRTTSTERRGIFESSKLVEPQKHAGPPCETTAEIGDVEGNVHEGARPRFHRHAMPRKPLVVASFEPVSRGLNRSRACRRCHGPLLPGPASQKEARR